MAIELESLRQAWQDSQDRVLALSRLVGGQDHVRTVIKIAVEKRIQQALKARILAAQDRAHV